MSFHLFFSQQTSKEHYSNDHPETKPEKSKKGEAKLSQLYRGGQRLRKKYWLNIWGVLFLLTVFLNLYYFQPIKWETFTSISSKSKDQLETTNKASYISLLVFGASFFIFNDLILARWAFSSYLAPLKKEKITQLDWLKLLSITFFIRSITPFSIGSEPYVILWLKKKGIAFRQASAIVSSLTVSWFLAQGIITWPSFIYLQVNNLNNATSHTYYWLIIAGLVVDLISTTFVFTISYCKRVHYFFGLTRLLFRYFLKKENTNLSLSKIELKRKYLENKSFKKEFKKVFFNLRTFKAIIIFSIQNLLNYSLYAFLATFFMNNQSFHLAFHIINISTTANNFVPTPGSEGSIQFTINKMNELTSLSSSTKADTASEPIQETVFLWRWFQKYQPFILSSLFIFFYFVSRYFRSKLQKKTKKLSLKKDTYQ